MSILKELTSLVADCFVKCGYSEDLGVVTVSDRPELCQFQCNGAFKGAKLFRKAPVMIANEVAAVLSENEIISKAEAVAPGFLNITVTDEYLLSKCNEIFADENLGVPQVESDTIVIDYGGPNIAKPLHIGHLRSAIIGQALKQLCQAMGIKAVGDVHLGDWGLQMGLVIAELYERYENPAEIEITAEMLNEIYPFASKKSKEDEQFKAKAKANTAKLQSGDEEYISIWKKLVAASCVDMKKNYERLGVDFEYWYGESDAEKYVPQLLDILNEKQLLRESEGAMVVDVQKEDDKFELPPVIIKKSDNSNIYATTDLATIIQRNQDFSPSQIWYVVDGRQSMHFTQVFRCAYKAGIVDESCNLEHLGFGTMNGSDNKPYKTRDGGVMRLSDLLDEAVATALENLSKGNFESEEERIETANKLAVASIKFGDLINHRSKDYIFDIAKFLTAEGKTGAYLLYMVTRIKSLLRKSTDSIENKIDGIYDDCARELLLAISLSGESFVTALNEKAPNFICENAYRLAVLFSRFYTNNHIISETDENKRKALLSLCVLTKLVIEKHLAVLGIETVDKM